MDTLENSSEAQGKEALDKKVDYSSLFQEARSEMTAAERLGSAERGVDAVLLEDAANLIATIANNESKALNFAAMAMSEHREMSPVMIYRQFIDMQGPDGAWRDMGHAVPGQYAKTTYEPLGAVVRNTDTSGLRAKDTFSVTEYGDKRGLAVVGIMLDLSLRHSDIALNQIFGKTGTTSGDERRSPYTRLQILKALDALEGHSSIQKLSEETGIDPSIISFQTNELKRFGIIEVDRFERGASDKAITWVNQTALSELKRRPDKGQMPTIIADHIQSMRLVNDDPITVESLITLAQAHMAERDVAWVREGVADVLADLKKAHVIGTASEFDNEQRSKLRIDPSRSELVTELLLNVQAIVEGDEEYLAWGRQRAQDIFGDVESVNQLLGKAREASPYKNKLTEGAFIALVSAHLSSGEGTASGLTASLGEQGRSITPASVNRVLRIMKEKGLVEVAKRSGKNYYRLVGGSDADLDE